MFRQDHESLLCGLNSVLVKYQDLAGSSPNNLRTKIPAQEMWRLFVDGRKQKDGWKNYDATEPGCLAALIHAFARFWNYAGVIDAEMIKQLHHLATYKVQNTNYEEEENKIFNYSEEPGHFRRNSFIDFSVGGTYISCRNTSRAGLTEFIAKIRKDYSCHAFSIGLNYMFSTVFEDIIIDDKFIRKARQVVSDSKSRTNHQLIAEFAENIHEDIREFLDDESESKLMPLAGLIKAIGATEADDQVADVLYRLLSEKIPAPHNIAGMLLISIQRENTDSQLHDDVDQLLSEYTLNITAALTPFDKLMAIISIVQSLEQLHPFSDANCRTFCMLLLNKLLISNGFPFAIMEDPNRFDMYSKMELAAEVIKGMNKTFELIENGCLYNYKVTEKDFQDQDFLKLANIEALARNELLMHEKTSELRC